MNSGDQRYCAHLAPDHRIYGASQAASGESRFEHDWADKDKHSLIHHDEHLWAIEKYGLYMLIPGTFGMGIWGPA